MLTHSVLLTKLAEKMYISLPYELKNGDHSNKDDHINKKLAVAEYVCALVYD